MSCCICSVNFGEGAKFVQVHDCKESILCFQCLISERWENKNVEAYKRMVDIWWEPEPLKCPICNLFTNFEGTEELFEYWHRIKKNYVIGKYETMLTSLTVAQSRVAVIESHWDLDKLAYARLNDKHEKTLVKMCDLEVEVRNTYQRLIVEVDKNNEITARYLNSQKRVREVIDEEDDEFLSLIQRKIPKKCKEDSSYNFVNPDISKSYPLSDIYSDEQSQVE